MSFDVLLEFPVLSETSEADVTLVRPVARVGPHVSIQPVLFRKRRATYLAREASALTVFTFGLFREFGMIWNFQRFDFFGGGFKWWSYVGT